jgi:hypothetical protein
MRKRTMLAAVILVAAIVVVGAYAAVSVFGTKEKTEYLVAQVYIASWNNNISMSNPIDVQFKISLDLNNDGTYEVQQSSDVWNHTYLQMAPFKLGGPVASDLGQFKFKIEVFQVNDGILTPMNYTDDGSVPVNVAQSGEGSADSWLYDATTTSSDNLACSLGYYYYVS